MSIIQRANKAKSLFLDVAEDIRYRIHFGEDRPQSTFSLKDKVKALSAALCVVAVVALCVAGVVRAYNGYAYGLHEHKIEAFEEYEAHFELIANEVYEYYTAKHEYNQNCVCLYAYHVNGKFDVYYGYDAPAPIRMLTFDMSEAESESFDLINKLFADESSDEMFRIVVSQSQVSFCKTANYAIVYRFDDEEPTYIDPNVQKDIFSQRISDGWYHSIEIPQEQ